MKLRKFIALALVIAMCGALVAGCGGNEAGGDAGGNAADRDYILIGIPNPTTGPIAPFGEGTPWAEELAIKTINDEGGIYIKELDKKLPVKLKIVDTESNSTKASEVTQKLIVDDKVDLIIARHTPDTALPVSAMAERYGVPTISTECPVDPWLAGGPYEWVYHAFWTIDTVYDLYVTQIKEVGLDGATVGLLFPNDPDGLAWAPVFAKRLVEDGFKISDPGRFPIGNSDWSTVINQYKADGATVVVGCMIPPDFANFSKQAAQLDFKPEYSCQGRSILFSAAANAMGVDLAQGQTCEVWWSPYHTFPSSITGQSPKEILDLYKAETGRDWTAAIGYKYAAIEIAMDVLARCENLEPETIRDAIAATDITTVVGPIKYDPETHVAPTPIVMGQWQLNEAGDAVDLQIINNMGIEGIPKTADSIMMNQ